MERKTKILLGTLIPTVAITAAVVGTVVGINIKNNKLYKNIQDAMVEIFTKGLCPIYRETFKTRKVADYIKSFITNLGLTIEEDNDYPPASKKTELTSGNLIYDIPATNGCENWKGVTLQAHMDMVCNYDTQQEPGGHDWSNGVDIVQEGNILHSRDYKTTIGADDGVGLSMILALTKYRNSFKHGPMRVLITADEEDGDSGASVVTLSKIKYERLINIDGSTPGVITKSCAGTYNLNCNIPLTWGDVSTSYQQFYIKISGIKGAHSASISKTSTPTSKIPFDLMKKLLATSANVELLQLTIQSPNNYLPDSFELCFATDKTDALTWINGELETIKQKYPLETGMQTSAKELTGAELKTKSLSTTNTTSLVNLFATDQDPTTDKIPFGVIKWIDEQQTKPQTSTNIAPLLIENNVPLQLQTLTRSCYSNEQEDVANKIKQNIMAVYPNATIDTAVTPPWELKTTPELVNILIQGFKKNGVSTSLNDEHGWLECAFFAKANENAQIASIGAKVLNEHEVIESTDISSYPPVIKTLIYTLQNIK